MENEAQMEQQLAEMARDLPSALTASGVNLIPDHQLPVERLRHD